MSHTPGPWHRFHGTKNKPKSGWWYWIAHFGESQDVRVIARVDTLEDAQRDANANLISAAPELLAACKAALGAFENNHAIDWGDLERAIAKAEGTDSPLQQDSSRPE